ncbi:MAG: hypothetical protein H7258_10985, partial [Ferruginibacter sp.]|nr:hypothetical protein [Ferruginibacter sp.]
MTRKFLLIILLTVMAFMTSKAQNLLESLNDTAIISASEAPTNAAPIMDSKWNRIRTKYFTLNIGVAMFLDYNTVS